MPRRKRRRPSSPLGRVEGGRKDAIAATGLRPGEFYGAIKGDRQPFEKASTGLDKKELNQFESFCKMALKQMGGSRQKRETRVKGGRISRTNVKASQKFSPEVDEAIKFMGWDVNPEEYNAGITFAFAVSFVVLLIIAALAMFLIPGALGNTFLLGFALLIVLVVPSYAAYYVMNYPIDAVRTEKIKALTYVPDIVGYMTMSMKLVPNLEKAVEFTAEHGTGKIANDLRKIIWDVQIGVYSSLAEAIDELAYKWGKMSEEFKRALMMIRASVLETTEAARFALLDKTMETILLSIKNKMEDYARSLQQPSIQMFYLGVLLPLILIIILPLGGAIGDNPFIASFEFLLVLYCVILPVSLIVYARSIIKNRPPTYIAPDIKDDHPELPPKGKMKLGNNLVSIRMIVILVLIVGIAGSLLVNSTFDPTAAALDKRNLSAADFEEIKNTDPALAKDIQDYLDKSDLTPYPLIFGFLITLSIAIAFYLYFSNIYKLQLQKRYEEMEEEFKDSLYVLASRLGENKPIEEAMLHTKNFLPGMKISQNLWGKTVENIHLLGLPLEVALFDPVYGSLKHNPSNIIRTSMKLLVDSVELGVDVAARTLMSLSMQLNNADKVTRLLTTLVKDITTMLKVLIMFISPIVLGVTTALLRVVINSIESFGATSEAQSLTGAGAVAGGETLGLGGLTEVQLGGTEGIITPELFLLVVAIYLIQLVIILTYFNVTIEKGENRIARNIEIATALPIAVIVFIASVFLASLFISTAGI